MLKNNFTKLLLFIILVTSSCGDFEDVQISGLESARLINFSTKGIEAELSVGIKNPNNMGFTVTKSDMQLEVNGINLGDVDLTDNVRVKKHSDEVHTFRIKSDLGKALGGGILTLASALQKKTVTVHLKGNLHVRSFLFFHKKVPFELTKQVNLQKDQK